MHTRRYRPQPKCIACRSLLVVAYSDAEGGAERCERCYVIYRSLRDHRDYESVCGILGAEESDG